MTRTGKVHGLKPGQMKIEKIDHKDLVKRYGNRKGKKH